MNKNPNNNKNGNNVFSTRNNVRLWSSIDDSGRRVRTRSSSSEWDDNDNSRRNSGQDTDRSNNSWDDFDPMEEPQQQQRPRERDDKFMNDDYYNDDAGWNSPRGQSTGRQQRHEPPQDRDGRGSRGRNFQQDRGGRGSGGRNFQQDRRSGNSRSPSSSRNNDKNNNNNRFEKNPQSNNRFNKNKKSQDKPSSTSRSINMNAIERAGFVHLYGLSSVVNALAKGKRDMETNLEKSNSEFDDFDDYDDDKDDFYAPTSRSPLKHDVKPQAQFRPYLFVQERQQSGSDRLGSKASAAQQVLKLANERSVPIAYVDKGILNVLSGNRPHQGFALRCGKLFFESLSQIPMPGSISSDNDDSSSPNLWLVLDEVVDPQNLGALLRSAYFLGGGNSDKSSTIGVLVCSKNSAPPSATVSASSAGALEVLDVHSTSNLPRTLNQAKQDGFRIIGTSSSIPSPSKNSSTEDSLSPPLYDLQDLPVRSPDGDDRPILLVLGSEGHGLRTLVAKACTEFVRIPSGIVGDKGEEQRADVDDDDNYDGAGVDSLNVSVTGGIMLWHLLHRTIGSD